MLQNTRLCSKYDKSLSTAAKVTYRDWESGGTTYDRYNNRYVVSEGWGTIKGWNDWCYSFSFDKTEMIIWRYSNPNKRDYYKLIDPESLKSNYDFLND